MGCLYMYCIVMIYMYSVTMGVGSSWVVGSYFFKYNRILLDCVPWDEDPSTHTFTCTHTVPWDEWLSSQCHCTITLTTFSITEASVGNDAAKQQSTHREHILSIGQRAHNTAVIVSHSLDHIVGFLATPLTNHLFIQGLTQNTERPIHKQ